jgi:acyl-CoA thioesterase
VPGVVSTSTIPFQFPSDAAILGRPHGGVVLSLLTEAALAAGGPDHPHPLSVSMSYLAPPEVEIPGALEVTSLRVGRRISSSRFDLVQGGEVTISALLTAGRLDPDSEPFFEDFALPTMLLPDQCQVGGTRRGGQELPVLARLESRRDPATLTRPGQVASTPGVDRAWLRPPGGRDVTVADLLFYADMLVPVSYTFGFTGWAPTVQLSFLLRALPAPGWIRAEQVTTVMQEHWMNQDCRLWDSRGRLVAQSRQLSTYRES